MRRVVFECEIVGCDCRQGNCLVVDGKVELRVVVKRNIVIKLQYECVCWRLFDFIVLVWEVGMDQERGLGQQAG